MFESARKILRVSRDCDREEVRRAYIRLTRRYPPEHFPERFKRIKQAYEELNLDPNCIESTVDPLAQAETPVEAFDIMLRDDVDSTRARQEEELPEPDCMELEPVLNADRYREELMSVLKRIGGNHPLSG